MTIYLENGATLAAVSDRDMIPILESHHDDGRMLGTWEGLPDACYASIITAIDCKNLTITGSGTIDGRGEEGDWWLWPKETRNGARRARTLFLSACENLRISGVSVQNSPSWTVHPVYCRDVVVSAVSIFNPSDSPNTDGLNPEACENVVLEGVHFSVATIVLPLKPENAVMDQITILGLVGILIFGTA